MKCPGCGTSIRESEFDGRSLIVEIGSGARDSERSEHTTDRCRTASGVAALVDAARDLLDYVEIVPRRQREETGLEMAGLRSLADSLRAALGALRST